MMKRLKFIKYAYLLLFGLVCLYMLYFSFFQARNVAANSYNRRLRDTDSNVVRGSILDRSGNILAKSTRSKSNVVTRKYSYGRYFSHIIGYSSPKVGSSGIEALYNKELMSAKDAIEALKSKVNGYFVTGNSVALTLDKDLQIYAADQMGGRRGAIVVIKPDTGEILAMVSKPDFSPSDIKNTDYWGELIKDTRSPLLNRASEGLYAPGSIFKLVLASSLLKQNRLEQTIECEGKVIIDGYEIRDSGNQKHGETTLAEGLRHSCNSYFIRQGLALGMDSISDESLRFRFNRPWPSDMRISESVFPREYDAKSTAQQSIGQGDVLITPFHAALIAASIANKGIMMQPYTVSSIMDSSGKKLKEFKPNSLGQIMDARTAGKLGEIMVEVVQSGTGTRAKIRNTAVAGKTGTAETGEGKSHAWFVGFAPAEKPKVAIAVLVEHGGSGSSIAAPVAGRVLKKALSVIK